MNKISRERERKTINNKIKKNKTKNKEKKTTQRLKKIKL